MRAPLVACFVIVSLATPACGYRVQQAMYPSSNASETIDVRVPQDQVERIASGLRQGLVKGSHQGNISVSTQPDYQGRAQTVQAQTDVYASALDDAHRKAQAIASREHVSLGPVESIQEILGGAEPISRLKGTVMAMHSVQVSPNQPVVLFVAFGLGSPSQTGDVPHVIAVYGLAAPQIGKQYGVQGVPNIVEINVNTTGKTVAAAIDALSQDDKLVHDALSELHIPQSAVTVAHSSTFQQ